MFQLNKTNMQKYVELEREWDGEADRVDMWRKFVPGRDQIIKLARGSMSQRAFGKLLGVSATAVQLWEKGKSIPDMENLAQIPTCFLKLALMELTK